MSRVWYALVEMDVTYASVKVYVTESKDVIKHHSNVIIMWRTSAIETTALLKKIYVQKGTVCKKTSLSKVWGLDRKIHPSRSLCGITRQMSWCQTVILGTDCSIYLSHQWQIFIFMENKKTIILIPLLSEVVNYGLLSSFVMLWTWMSFCLLQLHVGHWTK